MKVAIVGSRTYPDRKQVIEYVDSLPRDTIVVSGGAPGVDTWAEEAARYRGLGVLIFCVPKGVHLKAPFAVAAKARNTKIIEHADWVVAFWDGHSNGTRDSISKVVKMRKPYAIFTPDWFEEGSEFTVEDYERIRNRIKR